MSNTNRLALPYILQSQSQKEVTHNDGLNLLDALVQAVVQNASLNTPPASPTLGNCYIVGASPTGAWASHSKKIAQAIIGGWLFIPPFAGLAAYNTADSNVYRYDGTNWVSTAISSLQNLSMLGINASADATNKLAVASSAILFNHIGNGVQVKLNKNSAGDSASFLFQSNWSARAEFGLLGDDNFTLKVSPNGSTFFDSLKMLAASGRVALKSNGSGLSAAGTTQATATAITKQTNQFTTVAAGTGAVLPSPEQGEVIFVANGGASALNIYPAVGHSINALAANVALSLAVGKNAIIWAATTTKWYVNLSA
jgi:hypothetical protein